MDRKSFDHIANLIRNDPVFASDPDRRPQRPVEHQLAAFLIRMGGELAIKTSDVTGIAEGTLFIYCNRVSKAIRRLRDDHISWPSQERRINIKEAMGEGGFGGCIGICDGSLIRLHTKPVESGESYWCRKKMYAVSHLTTY